jgi:hypothetical protein
MMTHDILAVLVSTVPSESYFISMNRILTDKCTKLDASLFKNFVCLKDLIDAEDRMQHDTTLETITRTISNQVSDTNTIISPDDDSDGICDINVKYRDL